MFAVYDEVYYAERRRHCIPCTDGRAAAKNDDSHCVPMERCWILAPPDVRGEHNTRTAVVQAEQLFTNAIKDILCVF